MTPPEGPPVPPIAVDAPPSVVVAPASAPAASSAAAVLRQRAEDVLLVLLLLAVAIGFDVARGPTPSKSIPGTMTLPTSPQAAEPPSMDELWTLALTTGRGSPFDRYPRDVLLRDVPAWTSLTGAKPWYSVWTSLSEVTHPPLYTMSLRVWREAFGEGDWVAVAYSTLFSLVTLVFVYLAVRLAMGRAAGFWAGAILAVAPVGSYFAMEMRPYALLTAESAAAVWLLVRLTLNGPRWRDVIVLCFVLLLCLLTHYFSAAACLAAGLYALAISGRRWPRTLLCGVATAGLFAVIWLPQAVRQFHLLKGGVDFLTDPSPDAWRNVLFAVAMPLRLLAESWNIATLAVPATLGTVLLAGMTWVAVRRPAVRPFLVWFAAVVGFLLVTDILRHTIQLSFIRYAAAAQPAIVAFVPIVAAGLIRKSWAAHAAGAVVCGIIVVAQPAALRMDAPTFTTATMTIAPRIAPGDALLFYGDFGPGTKEFTTDAMLLEFTHVPGLFPRDAAILYKPMSAELLSQLRGRRAWLLTLTDIDVPRVVPGARVIERVGYWPWLFTAPRNMAYRIEIPDGPATMPVTTASATTETSHRLK